ncbi:MAG: chaperone protein, partial [Pseudomonadota bacterium]
MRRFWKAVALEQSTHGLGLLLDGRALKTPKRNALSLPT